ncbi:MAG TPA: DUF1761 domain-containing protein [Chitinophagaceae bacterium]|nr:DUF1761 domain-containing protein [Chitinophagaceae bacterium]
MDINSINWLAVLVAGISAFVLGGVWYSPTLFGNAWMKENKMTLEEVKKGNASKIYGWAFILSLLMAANLAMFLADSPAECTGNCAQKTDVTWGAIAGFLAGIWVFCGLAIVSLFEQRSARYIFINGGYLVLSLVLMGAIIGLWR